MTSALNPAARIFVAEIWGKVVGFIAVLHFPHPYTKNMKKVSRVVVLPDYQGIGIGKTLLNFVGDHFTRLGYRLTITTSHPSINRSMKTPWRLIRSGRVASGLNPTANHTLAKTNTRGRMTCSWEYCNASR